MSKDLIILGASGNVYDLLDILDAINAIHATWHVLGILDDRRTIGSEFAGIQIIGSTRDAPRFGDCTFINAIRSETTFREMESIIAATGLTAARFATLIHPAASVSARATVGRDVFVNFGDSVAGNVTLADHVSIGPNCVVGHDTFIDSYTSVAAGAILSGGVHVEQSCYIGTGAMIRQRLRVGSGALVGMGAVVVKDVEPETIVVGNPARPLPRHSPLVI